MVNAPIVAIALAPLVAWRLYSRIKRLTTRQRSRVWRHRTTLVFFPLLVLILALASMTNPMTLIALAVALAAGAALGNFGIRKTTFEKVGDEFFFTPHARIGAFVAMLFIGRMAWRAWEYYSTNGAMANQDFARSPLTLAVFGVLAGYYMTYAFGLLRWRKRTSVPVELPA
jgi:Na+(H+)/acetate symporter ActP